MRFCCTGLRRQQWHLEWQQLGIVFQWLHRCSLNVFANLFLVCFTLCPTQPLLDDKCCRTCMHIYAKNMCRLKMVKGCHRSLLWWALLAAIGSTDKPSCFYRSKLCLKEWTMLAEWCFDLVFVHCPGLQVENVFEVTGQTSLTGKYSSA